MILCQKKVRGGGGGGPLYPVATGYRRQGIAFFLSRRPYFACREEMGHHVSELAAYCEARITLGTARRYDKRPSAYRPRRTPWGLVGP